MWYFYFLLFRQIPKALEGAAEVTGTIIFLFFALLALINRPLEQALALRWEGVSPWWAILPIAVVLGYLMAKANYEAFIEIGGVPDRPETRRRFHTVFHKRVVPAHTAAKQLLDRFYGYTRLFGDEATSPVAYFAIIEPADVAFDKVSEALESLTHPVQFVGGEFLLAYNRMAHYVNLSLDDDAVRTAGVTREDPQVVNWQQLDNALRTEVRSLLDDPEFSTMRRIVRGV